MNKFDEFKKILIEENAKYNLTAILDDEGIKVKHFEDSLSGKEYFLKGDKIIEIGSGAGFPSIPLKIDNEDLDFTLVESNGKKCNFLNLVSEKLELKNVKVINGRCEEIIKEGYREKFDKGVARAVAPLNVLLEYVMPFIKVGGLFIAYKGEKNEVDISKNALKELGGKVKEIKSLTLSNGDKRNIVVIEKIKITPLKYPRGNGKERKKPL